MDKSAKAKTLTSVVPVEQRLTAYGREEYTITSLNLTETHIVSEVQGLGECI